MNAVRDGHGLEQDGGSGYGDKCSGTECVMNQPDFLQTRDEGTSFSYLAVVTKDSVKN